MVSGELINSYSWIVLWVDTTEDALRLKEPIREVPYRAQVHQSHSWPTACAMVACNENFFPIGQLFRDKVKSLLDHLIWYEVWVVQVQYV